MRSGKKQIRQMKRIILIFLISMPALAFGQQFPFIQGYNFNPFSLSPACAGITNKKTLFLDYRADWTGIEGGPRTYQLSYSDKFRNRVGLGGRFIYDKTDIFKQTLFLLTYTYEVKIMEEHTINFGLSLGCYRNSIDLSKYYNDPDYVEDMVLMYGLQKSKIKFASDISVLYRYKQAEAGLTFSNIMFGAARYHNTDLTYKPLKNYILHASYLVSLDEKWTLKPTIILRGGQNIPAQFEISPTVTWNDRFWGTTLIMTGGIFGVGLGGEVYKGMLLNYSYNLSTNLSGTVPFGVYGSHQVTLGIRLFRSPKDNKGQD